MIWVMNYVDIGCNVGTINIAQSKSMQTLSNLMGTLNKLDIPMVSDYKDTKRLWQLIGDMSIFADKWEKHSGNK
jgi:hypothetical protein